MESIHQRIKRLRENKEPKLSQEALAAIVGVSYQSVQEWEREGGTAPSRKRQQAVAKALGVSVEELMFGMAKEAGSAEQTRGKRERGLSDIALKVARGFDRLPPKRQEHVRNQIEFLLSGPEEDDSGRRRAKKQDVLIKGGTIRSGSRRTKPKDVR